MEKVFVGVFLVIALFGIGLSPAESQVVQPVYKDGDQWIYRLTIRRRQTQDSSFTDGDYKVTYQNGNFESSSTTFLEKVATVNLADTKVKWFDFPLKPGKKWDFSYSFEREGAYRMVIYHVQSNVKVLRPEPVQTAAGGFGDAIKLRRKDVVSSGLDFKFTYFYSPVAKSMVKFIARRYNRKGKLKWRWKAELIGYSLK